MCHFTQGIMILIIFSLTVLVSSILAEPTLYQKPDEIIVDEKNELEFGLPLETKLTLDKKTKLYIPPEISDSFTEKERSNLMIYNGKTQYNYCKVNPTQGPPKIGNWCRNSDGRDLCCGTENSCRCLFWFYGCSCVLDKDVLAFKKRSDKVFESVEGRVGDAIDKYTKKDEAKEEAKDEAKKSAEDDAKLETDVSENL